MKSDNLVGKRFGYWTVLKREPNSSSHHSLWKCQCDCGNKKIVRGIHLRSGNSKSCGCTKLVTGKNNHAYKHGRTGGIYSVWMNLKQRCNNPNFKDYKNYGARGIKVCKRWDESYLLFLKDMGERPSPEHQINRINNNGDYEPNNCHWATRSENMLNTRRNRIVVYKGKKMPLAEAVRRAGINYGTAQWRLKNGVPDEKALS